MRAKSCDLWKEILSAAHNLCYIKRFFKSIKFYSLGADLFNNYQEEDCALFLERYYYNKEKIANYINNKNIDIGKFLMIVIIRHETVRKSY